MLVLLVSYLLLVFVLPIALSAVVGYRSLHRGRRCPRCGTDTVRIQARPLDMLPAMPGKTRLHRRWCFECTWEGTVRVPRDLPAPAPAPVQVQTRATQTLDVRSLEIDGTPWRVMLQCWGKTGLFYGRLVFVAPSGRLWLDAVESFNGTNEHEVLGQALSLPDRLLATRLRRLVSDR